MGTPDLGYRHSRKEFLLVSQSAFTGKLATGTVNPVIPLTGFPLTFMADPVMVTKTCCPMDQLNCREKISFAIPTGQKYYKYTPRNIMVLDRLECILEMPAYNKMTSIEEIKLSLHHSSPCILRWGESFNFLLE